MSWALCKETTEKILLVYKQAPSEKKATHALATLKSQFKKKYRAYLETLSYTHEVWREDLYIEKAWEACRGMAEYDLETIRDFWLRTESH